MPNAIIPAPDPSRRQRTNVGQRCCAFSDAARRKSDSDVGRVFSAADTKPLRCYVTFGRFHELRNEGKEERRYLRVQRLSMSTLRYLTVPSIFVCPSRIRMARDC